MKKLKEDIRNALRAIEERESCKEMIRVFRGVPVAMLELEASVADIKDMKQTIRELWKDKKIKIFAGGIVYPVAKNVEVEINKIIKEDNLFLAIPVKTFVGNKKQ